MEKLIITAAVSGSAPTREQNPNVPYSPKEIAQEAIRCWEAGANVVHIHVRDPKTGKPAFEENLFQEAVERIRAKTDMLINLTTSAFSIKDPDPGERRLMPISLGPDLCSLDVGSLNFRGNVFINPADWVEKAALKMKEKQVKPEMEVFEVGHVMQARNLIEQGLIEAPAYFQICLGIKWGAPADLKSLLAIKERLPENAVWSVLGTGANQLPLTTHAMLLGGNVRVGFEDNLYLKRGEKAKSNAQFVERTVKLAKILQREIASCEEAKEILQIKK